MWISCGKGQKMFHVETTAWEGQHAYEAPQASEPPEKIATVDEKSVDGGIAEYGSYFWSKK